VAAFDDTTLEEMWKTNLGVGFNAPPMTFEVNGSVRPRRRRAQHDRQDTRAQGSA
jgi:sulfur carrier protein ThiS